MGSNFAFAKSRLLAWARACASCCSLARDDFSREVNWRGEGIRGRNEQLMVSLYPPGAG